MAAFERWNRLVEEVTRGQQVNNNRDTPTASQNAPNLEKRKKEGNNSPCKTEKPRMSLETLEACRQKGGHHMNET